MKAIILTAGRGIRLKPITDDIPKVMVPINGIPIIWHQIKNLIENGINEIYICVGYKKEIIMDYCKKNFENVNLNFIENKDYSTTNNMYSLYLAKEYLDGEEFILINGDMIFDKKILDICLKNKGKSVAFYDSNDFNETEPRIKVYENKANSLILPKIKKENDGRTIGTFLFNKESSKRLMENIRLFIEKEKKLNEIFELSVGNIFNKTPFLAFDAKDIKWAEVDDAEDLKRAELVFGAKLF